MAAVTDVVALGRGGLHVGRFGFGGAPLGNLFAAVEEPVAQECLAQAWEQGLRYFDTAPHYGAGLSERRIGAFLATKPTDQWVLSTKVGRLLEPAPPGAGGQPEFTAEPAMRRVFDFSREGVLRSFDASLQRLAVDHVDIVYVHDPDDHWRQALDGAWPALASLRDQGVIRSVGAGMKQAPMLTRFVRETDMDVVLLAGRYTLLDQQALAELLPACVERHTSVVLGGVFNTGVLANPSAASTFEYQPVTAEVLDRALRIEAVCSRHGVPLAAAALQFPLAHPAITTVAIGARNAQEVRENAANAHLAIPAQMWAELRSEALLPPEAPVPEVSE
jgi:D-threo-aldose 1-dehydrogenase